MAKPPKREGCPAEDVREIQLSILESVARFCELNDLQYFLTFGTLLGAVRHGGYIPWDDDIDIMMPRPDYERFCSPGVSIIRTGDRLVVASQATDRDWPFPYAKVMDPGTRLVEASELSTRLGVNIDVFPMDGFPQKGWRSGVLAARLGLCRWLMAIQAISPDVIRSRIKRALLRIAFPLRFVPRQRMVRHRAKLASRHAFRDSTRVGVLVSENRWVVAREACVGGSTIEFEGRLFNAPSRTDSVLRAMYGAYMTLPPVEQQKSHHLNVAFFEPYSPDKFDA